MKKHIIILFALVFCLLFAGCAANNGQPPESAVLTEAEALQIYHDFFENNFEVTSYTGMHGPWQLWGHTTAGELRVTKQVYINKIESFDYPVLVLAEFMFEEDGVTLSGASGLHAYLIKNGEVTAEVNKTEFDAIFDYATVREGGGWQVSFEGENLGSAMVNGEELFFLDFSGDVREDGRMEEVLQWFKTNN